MGYVYVWGTFVNAVLVQEGYACGNYYSPDTQRYQESVTLAAPSLFAARQRRTSSHSALGKLTPDQFAQQANGNIRMELSL